MSQPIRVVLSLDEETQRILDRWQAQFSPLVGSNRSRLVRLAVQTLDRLGFTAATVTAVLSQAQGLSCANAEQAVTPFNKFPAPVSLGAEPMAGLPKPPVRIGREDSSHRRRTIINGVNRRSLLEVTAARLAFKSPFFNKIGPIYSTTRRVA